MNIRQFFMCLNCIPPTKFTSTGACVLFTIYNSFPRESSQCIINFWFSWECHAMVKTSVWSWNKKWVICILSRSSVHLWWQREIFNARHPQLEALLLSYRELNLRGKKIKYSYVVRSLRKEYPLDTVLVISHLLKTSSKYLRSCKILQI